MSGVFEATAGILNLGAVSILGTVTVTGTVTTGGLTDAQLRATAVPVSAASLPLPSGATTETTLSSLLTEMRVQNGAMAFQYDYVDATTEYLGWAEPGSATSGAFWRVKKITTTGSDIAIAWADSNRNFDNVWDDRASLTYG